MASPQYRYAVRYNVKSRGKIFFLKRTLSLPKPNMFLAVSTTKRDIYKKHPDADIKIRTIEWLNWEDFTDE